MTKRTEAAYIHLFENIESNICKLQPTCFKTDYEQALRLAIQKVYINVPIKGCWFHFSQAVRRRCSKIPNFFTTLWSNRTAKILYHKFLAIPLLRADMIIPAFEELRSEAESPEFGNTFKNFLCYFNRQWILKVIYKFYIIYLFN